MSRYIAAAEQPGVAEAAEECPELARRLSHVKRELERLSTAECTKRTHVHRQQQLMRFCDARLRTPQRLCCLTLEEEHQRCVNTLQAYVRLLWEAMRPELLIERVTSL